MLSQMYTVPAYTAPAPPPPPSARVEPCVWMSAGLVAYKLCDRGFECESCPFDQAMRGILSSDSEPERSSHGRRSASSTIPLERGDREAEDRGLHWEPWERVETLPGTIAN